MCYTCVIHHTRRSFICIDVDDVDDYEMPIRNICFLLLYSFEKKQMCHERFLKGF